MVPFYNRLKAVLVGKARDLNDPLLFHKISLVAFFAWVGLGSDGLSSSCYGPEESFLALQGHSLLGIIVVIATVLTIFIITASYSQIIELFPSGGGGYVVASKLLSPTLGMVSGCALIIDYVLTIALSIASGSDAIFSLLPNAWHPLKMWFALGIVLIFIILNLRGAKESIAPLIPIFLFFIVTHVFIVIYALVAHGTDLHGLAGTMTTDIKATHSSLGLLGMLFLIMRAYSMGAGTYTGIEAVSNGISILEEPRVVTAKKTMRYMALSLSFMAGGLMLAYILYKVIPQPGKTLNAVLVENIVLGWQHTPAQIFIFGVLISEAVLLFVAAQTGFLDGPRVIANMALDRWFPSQFALLSERFVIKYGILIMGGAALVLMFIGGASVKFLIILYSINVFITFFLSQLGMVRHWWSKKNDGIDCLKKLFVNGLGLLLTAFILISVLTLKFFQGGWITILITGALVLIALGIKRYYYKTRKLLNRLDKLTYIAEVSGNFIPHNAHIKSAGPDAKTAVILVNGFNGMGLHTLLNAIKLFSGSIRKFIFIQAGMIDAEAFKGKEEINRMKDHVEEELHKYVEFVKRQGFPAESASAFGTDVADVITSLSREISEKHPESIFFGGQIVFSEETFLTRLLYNHTTFSVQRRLHQLGIPFLVLPVRVT